MAETIVKRLPCCRFRRTGKAMISVSVLAEDMSRNKCFFPRSEYHMFHVLYPLVTYLLTVPSMSPIILHFISIASSVVTDI
jgi:hypothetical protein